MILWIVLGYALASLLTFRFWSMPRLRKDYLAAKKKWDHDQRIGYGRGRDEPWYPGYVLIAIGLALVWPGPALYRLLWPKGIDAKAKKEEMKAKLKVEAEAALKEAERIAREYGLKNPKE